MVLVTDAEMRFSNASQAALRELGYSYEEILQLSVADVVVDRTDAEERYERYLLTGTQHGTITLQRKNGSAFEASYTASIRHAGDEQHYVSVLIPE
jgi:PAS domain S-box-containing protein